MLEGDAFLAFAVDEVLLEAQGAGHVLLVLGLRPEALVLFEQLCGAEAVLRVLLQAVLHEGAQRLVERIRLAESRTRAVHDLDESLDPVLVEEGRVAFRQLDASYPQGPLSAAPTICPQSSRNLRFR